MLLTVDIGNSNIVLGLFGAGGLEQKWRLNSNSNRSPDDYAVDIIELFLINSIDCVRISGAIMSSVVPDLTSTIAEAVNKFYHGQILIIGDNIKPNIPIQIKNKKEVGSDRLVNSVAGYEKFGGDLIIVDFGTATTFDIVGSKGEYLGGIITAGVNLAVKALHDMTAQLPKIQVKHQESVIGKSTVEAINSGIYFGYISMVEGLIKRIEKEYGKKMRVIITGGLAVLFEGAIAGVEHSEPDLILYGLYSIYKNQQK